MSALYVVVAAPGCYGDVRTVLSAHATRAAAVRAARRAGVRYVARECAALRAGDRWLRVYEQTSPQVHP